ncbi:MAG: alanine racemase [candidate division Zixibacteria bacterium]|nr:alanine racemase [candidate division Zixibacteria bacterium]
MVSQQLLNWIELSRSAFSTNLAALTKMAGGRMIAVSVKANAYGHGLPEIVSILSKKKNIEYLAIHSIDEALVARESGWKKKIMILGPVAHDNLPAIFILNLEPVLFSAETLEALGKLSNKLKRHVLTHVKLETGTNRLGITDKELPAFAALYKKYPYLKKPYGASTHFANIEDTTSHEYAQYQLDNFERMVKSMTRLGIEPTIRHTASSAALILFEKTRFDLVRPGISAYGHWPSKETYLSYKLEGGSGDTFKPTLSWKTRIGQIKNVPTDSFVGYGCTYRTTAPTKLAVLPIGYYDGYPRELSNHAYVLIKGKRAPVRGRVCMNLLMVDVTEIAGVKLFDEVTLIGVDKKERITAETLAGLAGTINYELLARLSSQTPRIIVD